MWWHTYRIRLIKGLRSNSRLLETVAELDAFLAEPRWDSVYKVVLGGLTAKLKRGVEAHLPIT